MAGMLAARRRLHESGALLVPGSDAGVSPAKPHDVLPYAPEDLAAAGLSPAKILQAGQITARFAARGPKAARARRRAPGFIRRRPAHLSDPVSGSRQRGGW
jgi:hypothetical protein